MRIDLLFQAFRGSSAGCKQRFAATTTASAFVLYHIFGPPFTFFSPPSVSIGLLSFLLSIILLVPYTFFYIAPYPWLLITYIIFHMMNPPDLLNPTPKAKKRDDRIRAGLSVETRNNRVVSCVQNLFSTLFVTALVWIIWTELNSPWRGLMPFDPNAEWLGGTGSDALYWILTLLWTPVLAVLGLSFFVTPCFLWLCALEYALEGISDRDWMGIGVEGEKLVDGRAVK